MNTNTMPNVIDMQQYEQPVSAPPMVRPSSAIAMDAGAMESMMRVADLMSSGRATVPKHLQGNSADCLAVIMQSMQWQMNPFAVAQKTHVVSGTLGYEAQLVIAVINSSPLLATRLAYEWSDNWSGVNGKSDRSPDRIVRVWATLRGESAPRELTVSMAQAGVRNSPNWEVDPRQQLAYLAAKRWARLHAPDVILGVYTPDELEEFQPAEREINPMQQQPQQQPQQPATRTAALKNKIAAQRQPAVTLNDVVKALAEAETPDQLATAAELAKQLASDEDKNAARECFNDRRKELREKSKPASVDQSTGEIGGMTEEEKAAALQREMDEASLVGN